MPGYISDLLSIWNRNSNRTTASSDGLSFGGSYNVYWSNYTYYDDEDIRDISSAVLQDYFDLEQNPKDLNSVRTNIFYDKISKMSEFTKNTEEGYRELNKMVAKEIYGQSIANPDEASVYHNEIINSYLNRSGRDNIYDAANSTKNIKPVVMPGGRESSICTDTACGIFADAGLINYLPWDNTAKKWSSSNDYTIDAIKGRKKNEEAWKHWTTVGSGRIEKSFQKLQPGDWVIYGDEEFFLPVGHKNRPPTSAGNESGKHSLIVLDITENGVLLGSGNAPSNENRGRTLDTRFFTWQKIGKNFDNRAAEVFRFTPQSDKVVKFEHEIYSGTGEFQANAVMGELLKELMIR
jgi:hypothetical protein|tara:strand:- start:3932 stop:4981 length:1050 start_codon:yes stop_codon:yes gene_type:complete